MSYYKEKGLEVPETSTWRPKVPTMNRPLRNVVTMEQFKKELQERPNILEQLAAAEERSPKV